MTWTWWNYKQVWQSFEFLSIEKNHEKKIEKKFKFFWKLLNFFGENRTESGEYNHLVLFINRTKPGTAHIETALTGESLYIVFKKGASEWKGIPFLFIQSYDIYPKYQPTIEL